jgi:hypothetical protein
MMTAVFRVFVLAVVVPSAGMVGMLAFCCLPPLWDAYPFVLLFGSPAETFI